MMVRWCGGATCCQRRVRLCVYIYIYIYLWCACVCVRKVCGAVVIVLAITVFMETLTRPVRALATRKTAS